MDMTATFHEQRLFFTTGQREGEGLDAVDGLALCPALLAPYRDLTRLRYDYPLVLVDRGPAAGELRSLTSVVDEALRETAPRGPEGERLRKHVLRLERRIRELVHGGARGTLSELWQQAAAALASPEDPSAEAVLGHVATKLLLDGEVANCDAALPARVVRHLWRAAQERKAKAFRATVGRLQVKLADILRAAFFHSQAGRRPESLRAALGGNHQDAFDFAVMSRLVGRNAPTDELPAPRRRRIEWALRVLAAQRFYPSGDATAASEPYAFEFGNCADAAAAFHSRLPQLAEVVKAIAMAELEAEGRYSEAEHDAFFGRFDEHALSSDDMALFPDYLLCLGAGTNDEAGNAGLVEMLSTGLPVRVLVEAADLLEQAVPGGRHFAFGVRSMRLANTATSLGGVFVVQSASSNLYALRERLQRAFDHRGAVLVSIYAGAGASPSTLPPYLAAAAAMEARAFPTFTYDPYAGDNQAARFSLVEDNPQPEADWPVHVLEYADEDLQRVTEEHPFTVADFLLCDMRYARHFARVPRERWNAAMLPADEWLARDRKGVSDAVPYLLAVDADDVLQRVIVDEQLIRMVAYCRTFWHRLQEQGGIHNSHAQILLARERAQWEQAKAAEIEKLKGAAALGVSAPSAAPSLAGAEGKPEPAAAAPAEAAARNPDEAWIETARCPSCNECQLINDRMFRYNENKQAYIADISAGTFRQLVEAAEACQVSIIHPGKPRDPNEPGLDDLIRRAEPFQ
jgi:hypothetical protein